MRLITMDEYEAIGREKVIEEIERTTGDGAIYISFDIDGLDAGQAMGTGVPEIGGLSPRDAQVMLRSLQGKRVVGADICEVAPMYDSQRPGSGDTAEFLSLMSGPPCFK
jgi:guanidinopropionase